MRVPPDAPPLVVPRRDPGTIVQRRHYRLITPLFGGGVETGRSDTEWPVSGKAIRGQLRFWWRATRGGLCDTVADLKEAEDERWGATGQPSPIIVVVGSQRSGNLQHAFKGRWRRNTRGNWAWQFRGDDTVAPVYAAFPLRPEEDESRRPALDDSRRETPWADYGAVLQGVEFVLRLEYPAGLRADVEAALWAWETFGGVGARTRRGFGAPSLVAVDERLVAITDATAHILDGLRHHVVEGTWPDGVTHVSRSLRFKVTSLSWQALIRRLQDFRQARSPGDEPNAPSRSRWPEPDAIRRITGKWSRHRGHNPVHPVERKFPRAVFGLPIIFHFKDGLEGPGDTRDRDPYDTTLQGPEHDRLASRLILRPLECKNGIVGLAAILDGPNGPPGGLRLKGGPGNPVVFSDLTSSEARSIPPLNGRVNALEAFLESLR
jgi:CRISPR-associated protein Cmr1